MSRRIVSWSLYWLGDLIHRLNDRALDRVGLWNLPMFRAYQAVMRAAVRVQGDGKGPWRPVAGTTSKEDSDDPQPRARPHQHPRH